MLHVSGNGGGGGHYAHVCMQGMQVMPLFSRSIALFDGLWNMALTSAAMINTTCELYYLLENESMDS